MEEKLPKSDVDFINSHTIEEVVFDGDKKKYGVNVKVSQKDNSEPPREYPPNDFLRIALESFHGFIDKTNDISIRLANIYEAKRQAIIIINQVNDVMNREVGEKKSYDFLGIIRQIDSEIDNIKLELELETIKNNNETNRISMSINRYIAVFATFAGLWYIHDILDNIIPKQECFNKEWITVTIAIIVVVSVLLYIDGLEQKNKTKQIK